MSQIAYFYLLKNGRRQELSNGDCSGAVSYTHLDVYKRQQLIRDLREEWGIVDDEPAEGDEDVENSDDAVVMRVGRCV